MPRAPILLALLTLVLLVPSQAMADIYRYVDRHGVTHYTNVQASGKGRSWKRVFTRGRRVGKRSKRFRGRIGANDPQRATRYDAYIREASLLYQLPQSFIRAVMRVESNFFPDAVSVDGAAGLMQLMPATAAGMGVLDPFNARQNVLGGTRFLRVLANKFNGDLVLTVAAYNAGPGAVRKYRGIPPYKETQRYVHRVLKHYYAYKAGENQAINSAVTTR